MKILLVQTSFLGDTVLSTPVIANIKKLHPGCELWMMTSKAAEDLVKRDALLDGTLVFDKRGTDRGLRGLLRKAAEIRGLKFDKAYVLHRSFRTAILMRLAGLASVGFREARLSFLYAQRMKRTGSHDVERNLSIFDRQEIELDRELRLFAPQISEISTGLASILPGRYILVAPGSVWPTKMWDRDRYRELVRDLVGSANGLNQRAVVVVGAKQDRDLAEKICAGSSALNLAGKTTLSELMYIVKGAELVVCNDSLNLHLASAFKIPTVALFCSTVLGFGFGPWRNRAKVLEVSGLECRPCGRHGHKRCPTGTNACMRGVGSKMAFEAVQEILCQS